MNVEQEKLDPTALVEFCTQQPKLKSSRLQRQPRLDKRRTRLALSGGTDCCGECVLLSLQSGCCGDAFVDDACFRSFLTLVLQTQRAFHIALHAYALLPRSAVLLLTPLRRGVLENWLQHCVDEYSEYFQSRFQRASRPLHYRVGCSRIGGEELGFSAQCFVESAPVRAGLCRHAGAHPWSSYCANSFGGRSRLLTRLPSVARRFAHSRSPHADYRDLIAAGLAPEFVNYIEDRLCRGLALAKHSAPVKRVLITRRVAETASASV